MFDLFKRKKIKGTLSGVELQLKKNMTLLDNALEEGFSVPYSCKSGTCKECLCIVDKGDVESLIDRRHVMSVSQVDSGHFLACQTIPLGEVSYSFTNTVQEQYYPAKIHKVTKLSSTIYRVAIEYNIDNPACPQAQPVIGQSCKVKKEEHGEHRHYSVSQIHDPHHVSFDISHKGSGIFSSWLCNPKNVGKSFYISHFSGSFGESFGSTAYNIAIAGGSGLGIVLGAIEQSLLKKNNSDILFIHATRSLDDAYDEKRLQQLHEQHPSFNYVRVISGDHNTLEITPETTPNIYKGRIQHFLQSHSFEKKITTRNSNDVSCLICGSQAMADDVAGILHRKGINHSNIETDFFKHSS